MTKKITARKLHGHLEVMNAVEPGFANAYLEASKLGSIMLDGESKVVDPELQKFQGMVDVCRSKMSEENFQNAFGTKIEHQWGVRPSRQEFAISPEHREAGVNLAEKLERKEAGLVGKIKEILGQGRGSFADSVSASVDLSR